MTLDNNRSPVTTFGAAVILGLGVLLSLAAILVSRWMGWLS